MNALAQEGPKSGDITVNMVVNYSYAYRQGTWVPINVLVQNEKRDFTGWVEVRTYSDEALESPIYRVPAACPKGSRKRFQVCCFLGRTRMVEVRLFDGQREVLDFPSRLDIKPIDDRDLLGLVLDEDGSGFGFLNEVVNTGPGASSTILGDRRFYREAVDTETLAFLSNYPQCYASFDVIILGNVDPSRVSERQRELLADYVRSGGTIAVCTGEYAARYHGTWVEDLAGITIGPVETIKELALAQAVFAEAKQAGTKDFRECIVAPLAPVDPEVKRFGASKTLATRRSLGSGYLYTLAVDADSRALQDCVGYRDLWREIAARRDPMNRLNLGAAAQFVSNMLPQISGVRIQSRASVITYLALYFVVAIVANWLFFNWLKRREWAWVMLVVFSFGFTLYAVLFGTAGRARANELQQIETLRVPKGGGLAELHACVGMLDVRTGTHSMRLGGEYALARGLENRFRDYYYFGPRRGFGENQERPFYVIQDDAPRIEGFRVGASEMRLSLVETDVPVAGGVDGDVELREDGVLQVDLVNNTGYSLQRAFLYLDGRMIPLQAEGHRYLKEIKDYQSALGLGDTYAESDQSMRRRDLRRVSLQQSGSESVESYRQRGLQLFREEFPNQVFSKGIYDPYGRGAELNPEVGPFLCGWIPGPRMGAVALDRAARETIGETFVIADVNITRGKNTSFVWRQLQAFPDGAQGTVRGPSGEEGLGASLVFRCDQTPSIHIALPQEVLDRNPQEVQVEVNVKSLHNHIIVFVPTGAPESWPNEHETQSPRDRQGVVYRITDWQQYVKDWDEATMGAPYRSWLATGQQEQAYTRYGRPRSLPPPPQTAEPPVKVVTGTLKLASGEPPCPQSAQPANDAYVAAKVRILARNPRDREGTPWH